MIVLEQNEKNENFYDKDIKFKIIDCRKKKGDWKLPLTIDLPEGAHKNVETLKKAFEPICKEEIDTHFCILRNVEKNKKENNKHFDMTLEALKELGKNYVSIIAGGYEAV
mmetsp:Transcript_25920/g.22856  ORF Transcript_25920/g.22856 Transcript_25920/m.22856 type:complete len:110 (+) Transcript_25920:1250-1579(+)|eukprot:CAMPEP_0114578702 /NCGR_PEP_ID=MMETSP0125-20121206/3209_1 /TAXON_ID=485358 ORGANISM="Aristerostoma sp., Strain ATCC 50986" /NCGR_SAMPLE_ID=MMETSP0125 /ASSEMBLY_ACC=CAM_ASM_000245 /LENGTH=109 /DNA_ID=CAMNT_0001768971 /DNA_START=1067 /DNA_END=1396 /DNA_ORIENTATION=+